MDQELARQIARVRHFNRFYTRQIGLLQEHLTRSPFSLAEARVLYELASTAEARTAAGLQARLSLDPGYLSRILKRFERGGLVERRPAARDARQRELELTAAGRAAFADLDRAAEGEVGRMLLRLAPAARGEVVRAMGAIERALDPSLDTDQPLVLRPPEPGDFGWIIQRHGALYAREYGFDASFEVLAAEIVLGFASRHEPARERLWIAERAGAAVGSVMLVAQDGETAKLRLLLVEPHARGHGVGRRLVEQCLRFARRAGYERIELWTNDVLLPARRLYEAMGFTLTACAPHHSFGRDLVGETWTRDL